MEPLSGDHPLGLASPLNYAAIQSAKTNTPSTKEDRAWMPVTAQGLLERSGEVFFLDILFHRMSEIACFQQLYPREIMHPWN